MRTTAEINLKINSARALGDLDRAMNEAFDPTRIEDTTRATEDLGSTLEETGGAARVMATALDDAGESQQQFKLLKGELRSVRAEAKRVNQELERTLELSSQIPSAAGSGGEGGGGGSGGGRGGGPARIPGATPGTTTRSPPSGGGGGAPPSGGGGGGAGGGTSSTMQGVAAGLGGIPIVGALIGTLVGLSSQAYQSHLGRARSRRGTMAARTAGGDWAGAISSGSLEGVGVGFGYAPTETAGMYSQFMSRAGGPLDQSSFKAAMGAQQTFGVDLGTSGGLIRGMMRGGSLDQSAALSRGLVAPLTNAVRLGLDGSELSAHMQETAQMVSKQVDLGVQSLNMAQYRETEIEMGERVGGYMGARMTRSFAQGVSDIGYRGAGGATEFMLAQQAGYEPGQGVEGYFSAAQRMQDIGNNPEMLQGYLQRFIRDGAGEATNIAMVQRGYSAATGGQQLHADTARRFISGSRTPLSGGAIGTLGRARGVHGDLATEAGFEVDRADAGTGVSDAMQSLTRSTINLMDAADQLSPLLEGAAGLLELATALGSNVIDMAEPLLESMQKFIDLLNDPSGLFPWGR